MVAQIFDELGLQLNDQLSGLPQATGTLSVPGKCSYAQPPRPYIPHVPATPHGPYSPCVAARAPAVAVAGGSGFAGTTDADAELQARLDNLRRE